MNKSESDGFEHKYAESGSTDADTTQEMQYLHYNEDTYMENIHKSARLSAKDVNSCNSSQAAKPASVQGSGMPIRFTAKQAVEYCMLGLDAGDANAMYELACHCLDGSISDELVQQIANNKTFKAKLSELAKNYANGIIYSDSDSQAFYVFKQAEDYNDPDVLCALGRACNYGWGVEKDVVKAVEYYVKAADAGSFEAMERLCNCKGKNVDEQLKAAFEHFRYQAAAGNSNAKFAVAYCYCYEIRVAQSCKAAIEMCYTAENKYNSNMMVLLGLLYSHGLGVEENEAKAVELYEQAADAGNKEGYFQLGYCYPSAIGVAKDREQAVFWYEKAAAQGHIDAANKLGTCYSNGYGVEKDLFKAFQYYKQAAIAGDSWRQRNTGDCYKNGKGVKQSYERAAYWYQKAVGQGNKYAQLKLDYCLERLSKIRNASKDVLRVKTQTVTAQSASATRQHEIGFLLARFAAELGCGSAYLHLSYCYYNGIGTARDFTAAAKCYHYAYQCQPKLFDCYQVLHLAAFYYNGYVDDRNEFDAFQLLYHVNSMLRSEINAILKQML